MYRSEDVTLGLLAVLLLKLLDVDVLPNVDASQAQRYKARTSDDHLALHIGISTNNGIALWRTIEERLLQGDVSENRPVLGLAFLGQTHE